MLKLFDIVVDDNDINEEATNIEDNLKVIKYFNKLKKLSPLK